MTFRTPFLALAVGFAVCAPTLAIAAPPSRWTKDISCRGANGSIPEGATEVATVRFIPNATAIGEDAMLLCVHAGHDADPEGQAARMCADLGVHPRPLRIVVRWWSEPDAIAAERACDG